MIRSKFTGLIFSASFILLAISTFYACNSCQNKNNKEQIEYCHTIKNARYNFSFKLPNNWKAKEVSDNGDGFLISTPDTITKINVYGEMIINENNPFLSDNQTIKDFTFNDGYVGKIYETDSLDILVSRIDNMIRVNAHLITPNNKDTTIKRQFLHMAKSLVIN